MDNGRRSILSTIFGWFRDLTFSVMIAVVLIVFIYQPVKVEGTSPGTVSPRRRSQ